MYTCDVYESGEKQGETVKKTKPNSRQTRDEELQGMPVDLKVIHSALLPLIYLPTLTLY